MSFPLETRSISCMIGMISESKGRKNIQLTDPMVTGAVKMKSKDGILMVEL